ncbi:MAG: pyridoxine 5'-phosphate synthase [Alphaproteobacteria bacterium]|nr:pyridoxine 5'-phosphate synthase [Alphaproteobacteria bacterium]
MTCLSVNLNAVAMLRNRRDVGWPSVLGIARLVLEAGAAGITVHPRPDERHIRRTDVGELGAMLRAEYPRAEYNIEGYPSGRFLALVEESMPDQVTFVPDDPGQATSDHGWDFAASGDLLPAAVGRMQKAGCRVALFVDADPEIAEPARTTGADRVELYTGPYGAARNDDARRKELAKLVKTANAVHGAGLGVNAGHDLTLSNLGQFIAAVSPVDEVSIGHGITADALVMGFGEAVRRYKAVLAPG